LKMLVHFPTGELVGLGLKDCARIRSTTLLNSLASTATKEMY